MSFVFSFCSSLISWRFKYMRELKKKVMHVFGGCRGSSLRKQPTFGDTTTGFPAKCILGDPGADKGGEGKSKRADKYIWNEEK